MIKKHNHLLWICGFIFILSLATLAFISGWKLFFFETDDAYIAYRYVANSIRGWGLVFNPPPFRPVEGYTSFLWVALLREIWSLFGVKAPQATFYLNPLFGYGSLLLTCGFILRMRPWNRIGSSWLLVLALVLAGVLSNRTYLTWLSSGLESSLFNFLFTWWVFEAFTPPRGRGRAWIARYSTAAALAALTRPDGMLMVMATGCVLCLMWLRGRITPARGLLWSFPLLAIPGHFLWRRATYGDWLPNTYYAKHLGAWPEAGWRYLASFTLENGFWVWIIITAVWAMAGLWQLKFSARLIAGLLSPGGAALAVLATHFGYYTFIIGGDHFEYRIYSHLIPLLFVSVTWMTLRPGRGLVTMAALASLALAALPIPWIHWQETRGLMTRAETLPLTHAIAGRFPPALAPIVKEWDELQGWLINHSVCVRHQEHKVFFIHQSTTKAYPPADLKKGWNHRDLIVKGSIGVIGWMLPNHVVIDELGLTDRVIGRAPLELPYHARKMGHDRKTIPEYIRCFRVNIPPNMRKAIKSAKLVPLTDDEIRRCEARKWY